MKREHNVPIYTVNRFFGYRLEHGIELECCVGDDEEHYAPVVRLQIDDEYLLRFFGLMGVLAEESGLQFSGETPRRWSPKGGQAN